jgi:hypothetical protein
MRLLVPWAMLGALLGAMTLPEPWRFFCFGAQAVAYALALARLAGSPLAQARLSKLCETMVLLNAAAVVGTFRFLRHGRRLQW